MFSSIVKFSISVEIAKLFNGKNLRISTRINNAVRLTM